MGNSLKAETHEWLRTLQPQKLFSARALIVLLINSLICTGVAVALWLIVPGLTRHSLLNSWVFAQCIGQSICLLYLLTGQFVRSSLISYPQLIILSHPAIVLSGFLIGSSLGKFFLNVPHGIWVDRQTIIASLSITILVSVASTWFYSTREQLASLKLAVAQEAAQASQARLAMLRAQLEPHMLFNTLANLRTLMGVDPQRAQLMLDQLIEFLRATLDSSQTTHNTLQAEFNTLQNYLSLMQVRLGNRLTFTLDLPSQLALCQVPTLLLQPLVENAIVHGIEPSIDGGSISVQARMLDDDSCQNAVSVEYSMANDGTLLELKVIDTGIGMKTDNVQSANGFGLHSLRARLPELANRGHQHDHYLQIESPPANLPSGTAVTIIVPFSPALSFTLGNLEKWQWDGGLGGGT